MTEDEAAAGDIGETTGELVGDIAHQFAVLVRTDLQLTAAEHAPELRRFTAEAAAGAVAIATAVLALAAASWAGVLGLTHVVSSWAAALVVAAVWTVATVLLVWVGKVGRLRTRLSGSGQQPATAAARRARSDAEQAIQDAAGKLAKLLVHEAASREVKAVVAAEKQLADTVERDIEAILRDLVAALSVPDKAGSFIGRLTGRRSLEP